MLPEEYRARGIYTQKQLVFAMLPYMKWEKYQDLRDRFWGVVTSHYTDAPLRRLLHDLFDGGLVEKKYGEPIISRSGLELSGHLYIRRISRDLPKNHMQPHADGTFGQAAAKERARKAKAGPKKPPKTTVKNLTIEDLAYIRQKPMTQQALAEMFGTERTRIHDIQNGYTPSHLKGKPAP